MFHTEPQPILTDFASGVCRTALEEIRDEFARRYPDAHCIVYALLHGPRFQWEISHLSASLHDENRCHIGSGDTPEAAFAHLDKQLGPPMSEPERLRAKAAQLMRDAAELEARKVSEDLATTKPLPCSSQGRQ